VPFVPFCGYNFRVIDSIHFNQIGASSVVIPAVSIITGIIGLFLGNHSGFSFGQDRQCPAPRLHIENTSHPDYISQDVEV